MSIREASSPHAASKLMPHMLQYRVIASAGWPPAPPLTHSAAAADCAPLEAGVSRVRPPRSETRTRISLDRASLRMWLMRTPLLRTSWVMRVFSSYDFDTTPGFVSVTRAAISDSEINSVMTLTSAGASGFCSPLATSSRNASWVTGSAVPAGWLTNAVILLSGPSWVRNGSRFPFVRPFTIPRVSESQSEERIANLSSAFTSWSRACTASITRPIHAADVCWSRCCACCAKWFRIVTIDCVSSAAVMPYSPSRPISWRAVKRALRHFSGRAETETELLVHCREASADNAHPIELKSGSVISMRSACSRKLSTMVTTESMRSSTSSGSVRVEVIGDLVCM
mmetsp:Transcript_20541/g.49731  ORF Transcript_20541/g.49731 Transcript_20541/m.49731 type:complete len:340 (+) Transcript_20541:1354-2373(+)